MLKAETDHLSLAILIPAQMASTHTERAAFQMTEEADVQYWNPSLDEDCSKQDEGAENVFVSCHAEIVNFADKTDLPRS